jgi:hypothetical protein
VWITKRERKEEGRRRKNEREREEEEEEKRRKSLKLCGNHFSPSLSSPSVKEM